MIANTTIPLLLIIFILLVGSIIAGKIIARTGSVLACRAFLVPVVAVAAVMVPPIHRAIAPHDMGINNWTIYLISFVALFAVMYKPAAWVLIPEFPVLHMPQISRPKRRHPEFQKAMADSEFRQFMEEIEKARR